MKSITLLFVFTIFVFSILADDDGFLDGSTCNNAEDCYIFDDMNQGLQLACWHNVKKCKCDNTIRSDHHLLWQDEKCRMSKYGPCGKKSVLEVDCLDGFTCHNNKCVDPANLNAAIPPVPYIFDRGCSDDCNFGDNLRLECNDEVDKCSCEKAYIADKRGTSWDIRNYDGNHNCSVGKFGPCGNENGIQIDCHDHGTACVNGACVDPNHPISDANEECETKKNCKEGLLCSLDRVCIQPNSLEAGKRCRSKAECMSGLDCRRPPRSRSGRWAAATCHAPGSFEPRRN